MAYILYHYYPSLAAAIVFIVLFVVVTGTHVISLLKTKTWYFIPFIIGGFFEFIGYIGRAVSSQQSPNWTTGPYIVQSLLLLLAPAFFAASIYMILGRMIVLTDGAHLSPIRVSWLTKIFVIGDVLSFFIQSGGGGMLAKAQDQSAVKLGQSIIIGGLVLQILFFGLFIVAAIIFHVRIRRTPTQRSKTIIVPWKQYFWVLYAATFLILVRNLFRVIEYAQGQNGSLLKTEVWLYVFDATLMFITMVLLQVFHPSRILSKEKAIEEVTLSHRPKNARSHKPETHLEPV